MPAHDVHADGLDRSIYISTFPQLGQMMRFKNFHGALLHIAAEGGSTGMLMAVHAALERELDRDAVCAPPLLNPHGPLV